MAALQRVLDLQTQLPAEPIKPNDLVLGGLDLGEPGTNRLGETGQPIPTYCRPS